MLITCRRVLFTTYVRIVFLVILGMLFLNFGVAKAQDKMTVTKHSLPSGGEVTTYTGKTDQSTVPYLATFLWTTNQSGQPKTLFDYLNPSQINEIDPILPPSFGGAEKDKFINTLIAFLDSNPKVISHADIAKDASFDAFVIVHHGTKYERILLAYSKGSSIVVLNNGGDYVFFNCSSIPLP